MNFKQIDRKTWWSQVWPWLCGNVWTNLLPLSAGGPVLGSGQRVDRSYWSQTSCFHRSSVRVRQYLCSSERVWHLIYESIDLRWPEFLVHVLVLSDLEFVDETIPSTRHSIFNLLIFNVNYFYNWSIRWDISMFSDR